MATPSESRLAQYRRRVGYVPRTVETRARVLPDLDPEFLELVETYRANCLSDQHLAPVSVELLMFGILLTQRDEDARVHAQVAMKEGATVNQLLDVAKIAGWLAGAQVLNLGIRLVEECQRQ